MSPTKRSTTKQPPKQPLVYDDYLETDRYVTSLLKTFRDADANVDAWEQEIYTLHSSRALRALDSSRILESAIQITLHADLDNAATRSRLTEIKLHALGVALHIEERYNKVRKYLLFEYAKELSQDYSTVQARKDAVEQVLYPVTFAKSRLEKVVKLADVAVEDCSSASFTLNRVVAVLDQRRRDK